MRNRKFEVTPSGGGAGAFVVGVDLSLGLSKDAVKKIRTALGEYGVVFFRDQTLSPEQHISMAKQFGAININRFFATVDGHPNIAEVRKEPTQAANIGGSWHTDHSYDLEPAMGSILVARETPSRGGDTLFASMFAAYDSLSEGVKKVLESLQAWHSSRHAFGDTTRIKSAGLTTATAIRAGPTGLPASHCDQTSDLRAQGFVCESRLYHWCGWMAPERE